ncbi:MAG: hypothetical protein H6617_11955 [Bdellovibrionaceae bacterium]|nr:hypothetical protein [Pseudobdellovibrionaceae bacterium]
MGNILNEASRNPFKRSPQVRLGMPEGSSSEDFHLLLTTKHHLESEKGTFSSPLGGDSFLVFRNPIRLRTSFVLFGKGLPVQTKLNAFDKLNSYFFDNHGIDPILPDSYKEYPALYKKLSAGRAEIRVNEKVSGQQSITQNDQLSDTFQFRFDYIALYHSGNPLREDKKVKQRIVEITKDDSERSVL